MSTEQRVQIKSLLLKEPREIIKVGELLAALDSIKEDNTISISVKQNNQLMTVAYICGDKECGALHLAGGRDIEFNYDATQEIFVNRSNTQDTFSVKKSELVAILKNLDKDKNVLVATMDDDGFYALASAYLCPNCDSIHLSANYYKK